MIQIFGIAASNAHPIIPSPVSLPMTATHVPSPVFPKCALSMWQAIHFEEQRMAKIHMGWGTRN